MYVPFVRVRKVFVGAALVAAVLITQAIVVVPAHAAAATFDDEFNTFSMHRTWQTGDNWGYAATDSTDGRGGPNWGESGDQWWVNPLNPNTPISGLYSQSNGQLQLGLLPTPPVYQSYIDAQAGAHMPFVGTLLNNQNTAYQIFGYYEVAAAVDRVPGFTFQSDVESVPAEMVWPPEIDFDVYTDANNVQWVNFSVAENGGATRPSYSTSSNDGFDARVQHTYGWNWQRDFITFYIDGKQVFQTPTPQNGDYTLHKAFMYILTGANYGNAGLDPNPASLQAYAHIDAIRIYPTKPILVAPTATLTANPTSIKPNATSTLTWSSTQATSCSGTNFTASSTSGSAIVTAATTTTYTVTCTGTNGSVSASTRVTVIQPTPAPTAVLIANPQNITAGSSTSLTWSSTNATSCTGTNFSTGGTVAGVVSASPTATTTYTVSCTGAGGTAQQSVTVGVTASQTPPPPALPTAGISANPTSIKVGSSTTLTWSSTNATACTGTNFATNNATAGSVSAAPTATTTYTVSCAGAGGSAQKSVTVGVQQAPAPLPTVGLVANPTTINSGTATTLTWSSTDATACTGTNFATGNATSGSVSASPSATTTYTVSCTGAGGTVKKSVTVGVKVSQVILTPTSGGTIKDSQGNTWSLTSNGDIMKNGVAVPGGGGTSALTYTSTSQKIWGQDASSKQWYYWDGANWIGPYAIYQ